MGGIAQAARYISRPGRHVEVERTADLAERHPFGHGFEVIDRLCGLDLDHAVDAARPFSVGQHEVGIHDIGTRTHP